MLDVARTRHATDPSLLPGEILADKYRIERVLGQGGMGVVLAARNLLLGKRVAVKILAPNQASVSIPRLLMEARAAARLESDHVVRVFDVGHTASGEPYLVMEHLDGQPLSELLARQGPASVAQSVRWVLEACEGLAEAHAHGIVHRDVKPANLFLEQRPDASSRIKVLDFGIAKLPAGEGLTMTTHPIGSLIYMAPEQLANTDVDGRVDVWGLGCVLYELLTSRAPFEARSVLELAAKISEGRYRPAAAWRPDLPEALSGVIDRCLQAERVERFPDMLALAEALSPFGAERAEAFASRLGRVRASLSSGHASNLGQRGDADESTRDLPDPSLAYAETGRIGAALAERDALGESVPVFTNSSLAAKPRRRALHYALIAASIAITLLNWLNHAPKALDSTSAGVAASDAAASPASLSKVAAPIEASTEAAHGAASIRQVPPSAEPHSATARPAKPAARAKSGNRAASHELGGPLPIDRTVTW